LLLRLDISCLLLSVSLDLQNENQITSIQESHIPTELIQQNSKHVSIGAIGKTIQIQNKEKNQTNSSNAKVSSDFTNKYK
jgi:hypothetical protein